MRAQSPLTALLSAAALLAACETNTSPEDMQYEPGPTVQYVAPSLDTIEGERFIRLQKPGRASCVPGKC